MPIRLGSKSTVVELKISDAHVLSSMSSRWIESTKKSGRFSPYNWNNSIEVKIDTLDSMINIGIPTFIKIDVKGYELEVLQGLSEPIKYLSLEFTADDIEESFHCLNHLDSLGSYRYNISLGESLLFKNSNWESLVSFKSTIKHVIKENKKSWGDIYAIKNPT